MITTLKKMMAERGSVLMETILVIPLYIAFFSGIYLLGDLELGRNRLTAADRFAVWLSGSRYEDNDDETVKKDASKAFFPDGEFAEGTKLESFSSHKTKADWYSVVRGATKLKMVLPVWAVGCRKGVIQLFADIGRTPDKELWDKLSFKAREIKEPDTHSVLMRAAYDIREKSGRELAQGGPLWYVEYRTAFIDREGVPNDKPDALSASDGAEYIRNPQFERWSK